MLTSRRVFKWIRFNPILLGMVVAGIALAIYAFAIESYWIEFTHHTLQSTKDTRKIRVAQLSDLHIRSFGQHERLLLENLSSIKPDLVVLSGDVIDSPESMAALSEFLASIGDVATVAVPGNWEYWGEVNLAKVKKLYEKKPHTHLLINETISLTLNGRELNVVGLDDFTAGQPDNRKLSSPNITSATTILVQHSPGFFSDDSALKSTHQRIDLCLSGHTHGGQITLFGWPVWTPRGSGQFVAGWYHTALCPLYVSRGLGTSIIPARLGSRPEIAFFDL